MMDIDGFKDPKGGEHECDVCIVDMIYRNTYSHIVRK